MTDAVSFEVFGKVQGVFFRKYTKEEADRLGLSGWCANTASGTVRGEVSGTIEAVAQMKQWLTTKGSPKSKIEKTEFGPSVGKFKKFEIRK